ncbi:GNAT family N-acetyltransferase [Arthrobacter livingstonensis]|uniref:GNAT family N-acetyltransferase n=1 Tax=Arthrobacter livingstonensis TaxID=670078 RepID=UPI00147289E4|nr:GNAT family N-acetyltransferase [Arthrobacter livingstonensis]
MKDLRIRRLGRGDLTAARELFTMMVDIFEEGATEEDVGPLTDDYLDRLLDRDSFWAFIAFIGSDIVGGLTAHTLPMTRSSSSVVFIYDLAVRLEYQRRGVGSLLIHELRDCTAAAGIREVFVAANNEDTHALDFYRAQGAVASPVTFFTFTPR